MMIKILVLFSFVQKEIPKKICPLFLEVTPPSFTEKEPYTTDQLFSIIHAFGNQKSIKDRVLGIEARFSLEIISTQMKVLERHTNHR